jgi:hypothetical protein
MPRTQAERSVLIRERDLPGFLDMLRYDGCTVIAWSHDQSRNVYEITLRAAPGKSADYEFTVDRWRSFGINISDPVRVR